MTWTNLRGQQAGPVHLDKSLTLNRPEFELDWPQHLVQASEPDYDTETETETETGIDVEFIVMDEEEFEKPYRIIIHNDDVTTFEFVINILVTVFELTFVRATHIAFETHNTGASYVCTLPLEEAKRKVFKAQFAARQQGFPLTFSIEPE